MGQRSLTPKEESDKAIALDVVALIECELKQRIPPYRASIYMGNLRDRVAEAPDLVTILVAAAGLPDLEKQEKAENWVRGLENEWKIVDARFHNPDGDLIEPPVFSATDFPFRVEPEFDILMHAACGGSTFDRWQSDSVVGALTYVNPEVPSHRVRLEISDQERADGVSFDALCNLVSLQDADAAFVLLYVSRLLAPPGPLPINMAPVGRIDLDDVIANIGWLPRSTHEREEMRKGVWDYLRFFARAGVYGQRSSVYRDKATGELILTVIEGPIWSLHERERPLQRSLLEFYEVPFRVEISMTRTWTMLITDPRMVQYLPLGELLGGISGNQPSGAWARCIGMALVHFWLSQPALALAGKLMPMRRELLLRYMPKKAPPEEVLSGPNPKRAQKYWRDALQVLVGVGFILPPAADIVSGDQLGRQDWDYRWLEERVLLKPGKDVRSALEAAADARLAAVSPPVLKRGRGRPRKLEK